MLTCLTSLTSAISSITINGRKNNDCFLFSQILAGCAKHTGICLCLYSGILLGRRDIIVITVRNLIVFSSTDLFNTLL